MNSDKPIPIKLNITVKALPKREELVYPEHSQYKVETRIGGTKVVRRCYKDFADFYSYLLKRYCYSVVPILLKEDVVVESILQTWLTVLAMHPIFGWASTLNIFLIDTTPDYQSRLREKYEKEMEYFGNQSYKFQLTIPETDRLLAHRKRLQKFVYPLNMLCKIINKPFNNQEYYIVQVDKYLRDLEINESLTGEDICGGILTQSVRPTEKGHNAKEMIKALVSLLAAYFDLYKRLERVFPAALRIQVGAKDISSGIVSISAKQELSQQAQGQSTANSNDFIIRKCGFVRQCVLVETVIVDAFLKYLPAILLVYLNR